MKENADTGKPRNSVGMLGTASTMGLHMVSAPLVGGGIGYFIDGRFGTWPYGSAIGVLLGIAAGFRMVYEDSRRIIRAHEESLERDQPR
ncbi:MAG: AtpZ/AtpI family protein [Mailhella sp.]|nr:AtpZ/AtpI family protein [Mailhella sp.]